MGAGGLNQHEHHLELWSLVIQETGVFVDGIHGPQHWSRVERNGLYLAQTSGADPDVVSMFALFHDSCRVNDHIDPEHGRRGAEYAKSHRAELDFLSEDDFERLVFACTWHTDMVHHDDPTIHTCFDADRLDLGRVGISPHPKYLNTPEARLVAMTQEMEVLDVLSPRVIR